MTEAKIERKSIVIRLPIAHLQMVVLGGWAAGILDPIKVTDAELFAEDLCHALNSEEEDGTTPLHRMFDASILAAFEQGADGCEEIDEEEAERLLAKAASKRTAP